LVFWRNMASKKHSFPPFSLQLKVLVWLNINCNHPHNLCVPVNHQHQSLRKQITILYKAETGKNTLIPQEANCTEKYTWYSCLPSYFTYVIHLTVFPVSPTPFLYPMRMQQPLFSVLVWYPVYTSRNFLQQWLMVIIMKK